MAETFDIEPAAAEDAVNSYLRIMNPSGLMDDQAFQDELDDAKRAANITANVPLSQIRDLTLARQVLQELNIPES